MSDKYRPLTKGYFLVTAPDPLFKVADVESAVDGIKLQLAALSGYEASLGNKEAERVYDNALSIVNQYFPVFKEDEE